MCRKGKPGAMAAQVLRFNTSLIHNSKKKKLSTLKLDLKKQITI